MRHDLGFRGYDTVYLLAPLTGSVIAGLPAAAAATERRERLTPRPGRSTVVPSVRADATDLELIAAARAAASPMGLVTAGDRAAVLVAHADADGVEGTRIVAALLELAAGGSPVPPPRPVRRPLLRALRAGGTAAIRAYLAGRADRRAMPDPAAAVARTAGRFTRMALGPAEVAAVRRTRSAGGRATPMSRVASITIAALGSVADPDLDVRVVLPVDLRHLAGGGRVVGNFISAEAYGTLRTTDWSPAGISRLLAARRTTGAVALAAARTRSLLRRGGGGPGRPALSLSLLGAVDLPDVWADGAAQLACATIGTSAGTFVFVCQLGDTIAVSVWDDTGAFAVERFAAAFQAEVARRTP